MKILTMSNGKSYKVMDDTEVILFKDLDEVEELSFRKWTRDNPTAEMKSIYHPACQDEWFKMQEENHAV
jgi:hypothetical protein